MVKITFTLCYIQRHTTYMLLFVYILINSYNTSNLNINFVYKIVISTNYKDEIYLCKMNKSYLMLKIETFYLLQNIMIQNTLSIGELRKSSDL